MSNNKSILDAFNPKPEQSDFYKDIGLELKVVAVDGPIEEYMKTPEFKDFTQGCVDYTDQVANYCMAGLSLKEKYLFLKWWFGGPTDWEDINKNYDKVYNAIMTACSRGCG